MADHERAVDLSPDIDPPDPVESDPAALNSAEDLDEDRLDVDPLEKGMDPPEHWSAADRRGMTPNEQATPASLDERLAEEQPDVGIDDPVPDDVDAAVETPTPEATDEELPQRLTYDEELGTSADVAGGSMADEIRTPPPAR
jgi:midasin (ATPase involved in ribosome maturation)